MKIKIQILFYFLFCYSAFCQKDSALKYFNLLEKEKKLETKVELLIKQIDFQTNIFIPDALKIIDNFYIKYGQNLDQKQNARINISYAKVNFYLGNIEAASKTLLEIINQTTLINNIELEVIAKSMFSFYSAIIGETGLGEKYLKECEILSSKNKLSKKALFKFNMSLFESSLRNIKFKEAQDAIVMAQLNNTNEFELNEISLVKAKLATLFFKNDSAAKFVFKSIQFFRNVRASFYEALGLQILGTIYFKSINIKEGNINFNNSLRIFNQIGAKYHYLSTLMVQANANFQAQNYPVVYETIAKANPIAKEINCLPMLFYINIYECFFDILKSDSIASKSKFYSAQSIVNIKGYNYLKPSLNSIMPILSFYSKNLRASDSVYKILEKTMVKNFDTKMITKSLEYSKYFFRDSIYNSLSIKMPLDKKISLSILFDPSKYTKIDSFQNIDVKRVETEFKVDQIKDSIKKTQNELVINKTQKNNLYLVLSMAALLIGIGGYYLYRRKNENKKLTIEKNKTETLIRSLHHETKRQFGELSNDLKKILLEEDPKRNASKALTRVETYSNLYNLLQISSGNATLSLNEALLKIFESNCNSFNPIIKPKINLDLSTDIIINSKDSLPFYFNELIANSMEHAFQNVTKPEITIKVSKISYATTFLYKDNGIGMKHIDDIIQVGKGLYYIKSLAKNLKGKLEHFNDNGNVYKLTINDN